MIPATMNRSRKHECARRARRRAVVVPVLLVVLSLASSAHPADPAERPFSDSGKVITKPQERTSNTQRNATKASPVAAKPGFAIDEAAREQANENLKISRQLAEYTGDLVRLNRWLVIVTFVGPALLLVAASVQAWIARDAEKRELRAYVFVHPELTDIGHPEPPVATVTIKNSGKTPAYRLTNVGGIAFPQPPGSRDADDANVIQPSSELGPGDITTFIVAAPRPLLDREKEAIRNGTQAIYVYGLVRYRDAFKKKRLTRYRYMIGGAVGVHARSLAVCEEGNEAT